jgi:hypothetical protein
MSFPKSPALNLHVQELDLLYATMERHPTLDNLQTYVICLLAAPSAAIIRDRCEYNDTTLEPE